MRLENIGSFFRKNPNQARQLNINFVDLEKDKNGKTIYDFLEKAGIKQGDEEYQKILNSLTFKNGYFYVNGTLANEYFYWKKVYSKDKKQNSDQKSSNFNVIKNKEKLEEKPLSEKEQRRRDVMYGQLD
jgi:hypothetical protein